MLTPNRFRSLLLPLLLAACSHVNPEPGSAVPTLNPTNQPYSYETQWGAGGSGEGLFRYPAGVAVDGGGKVYVADSWNHRVQKFKMNSAFLTRWGGLGAGDGQFNYPNSVAVDGNGNVYVTDSGNHRVQKFGSDGTFLSRWGAKGTGDGQFNSPSGVAVDRSGDVYVADTYNHRIQKFGADGTFLATWGALGPDDGQFRHPAAVAVDRGGSVYVTDSGNHRVQKFNTDGTFVAKWGVLGPGDGSFSSLRGIAVDGNGDVYVTDAFTQRVQKFSASGTLITKWGTYGSGAGQFHYPHGVAVDGGGSVYVTDHYNRVQKFSLSRTAQAVTFDLGGFGKTYGDTPFSVSAVASSGLPVSFTSDTPAVCTVSDTTVTLAAAGTCTLTASQNGDTTYAAAKGVSQSFPVAKAAPFIWLGNSSAVGERGKVVEVVVTSSSDAALTLTAAPETVCTLADRTLSLLSLGDCTVTALQPETANFSAGGATHVVKVVRTLTPTKLTAVSGSSSYGGAATLSATLTGADGAALAGETVSFEVVVLPVSEVGSAVTDANGVATLGGVDLQGLGAGKHPVIVNFSGDDSAGLEASHALGEVTVAQAAQTVAFGTTPPNPATVGGSYATLASATSGLPVALVSDTTGVCTLSGSIVSFVGAGTCTLAASQAGDANVAAASARQSFAVAAPTPVALADLYRLDFERTPANRLVYSVGLGSGMARLSGDDPSAGTVPVVGKRRVGSGIDPAHLARVVSLYDSKRLVVASPNSNLPAPTGGRVKLSFTNVDPRGVTLTSLTLSNLTARGATLTFYYADGRSSQQNLGTTRAGGHLVVPLNVSGLRAVDVFAPSAYAVDDVTFIDVP